MSNSAPSTNYSHRVLLPIKGRLEQNLIDISGVLKNSRCSLSFSMLEYQKPNCTYFALTTIASFLLFCVFVTYGIYMLLEMITDYHIGFAASFCTTVAFIPQVFQAYKTNDTTSLNTSTCILYLIGQLIWLIYGIQLNDVVLIPSALLSFMLWSSLLWKKWQNRSKETKKAFKVVDDFFESADDNTVCSPLDVLGFAATTKTRGMNESMTQSEVEQFLSI